MQICYKEIDMKAVEIKNLRKEYNLYRKPIHRLWETLLPFKKNKFHKSFLALDDVSFAIDKGECFGIIGENGAGKSTILKIITGVLAQSSGEVIIDGTISALLELGAGFNLEYTGLENIYMNALVYGISKEEMNKRLPSILEFADIGEFIYQPVKLYSSGMFARLAFALQISFDPDILIVDEALAVGDIFFQAKCYKKFEEFKKRGKTIIFVTHDMSSVLAYCDRVLVLNKGKTAFLGEAKDAVNVYKQILANTYDVKKEKPVEEQQEDKPIDDGSKWMDKLPLNPNPTIYGNGEGDILDFGVFDEKGNLTNTLDQFSRPCIKVRVKALKDINGPIVAFKFKNTKNEELMGTNTMYENVGPEKLKAGEEMLATFRFDMPLAAGEYLLDIGFTHYQGDNLEVAKRLHEITTINVLSKRHNVGFVNPNAEVKVEKIK